MPEAHGAAQLPRIETFHSRSLWDLQPLWRCEQPNGHGGRRASTPGVRGIVLIGMPVAW